MFDSFSLYTCVVPGREPLSFVDFQISRYKLFSHLAISSWIGALSVSPTYAKQLMLLLPSDFVSGRFPLYICGCCGDLGCGAVTVQVEETEDGIVWRDFGWEGLDSGAHSPSVYMERTGPFLFEPHEYRMALTPYSR